MPEDMFLPLFIREFSKIKAEDLSFSGCSSFFRDFYGSFWSDFGDEKAFEDDLFVCDGSFQSTKFRGGISFVYSRALAHHYNKGSLIRILPRVDLKIGHRLRRISVYMKALELKTLDEALDSGQKNSVGLVDGTLYPSLPLVVTRLSEEEVEGIFQWLDSLKRLLKNACSKGQVLLGISKDSDVSYARVRFLVNELSEKDDKLREALNRERSLKRVTRRLREIVSLEKAPQREMLLPFLAEFERPTSDEEVFDDCTSEPGYSKPLILAPQQIYISEEIERKTFDWWGSEIRRRLSSTGRLTKISEVLDELYTLPPLVSFYWRPWHGLGVFRVDVGGWFMGLNGRWGDAGGDSILNADLSNYCRDIVEVLNGLSPEPYVIKPLVDVDEAVRLSGNVFRNCYNPLIKDRLRELGSKALPTKRELRDFLIRRLL